MNENQQNKNLNFFRSQIDEIDLKILELLGQRMEIVKNVALLKKDNNVNKQILELFNENNKN